MSRYTDRCRVARSAARDAARWATRRHNWTTAALAKMLVLHGESDREIAQTLGLTRREVKRHIRTPLIPYAVAQGQPVAPRSAVQSAVDAAVEYESGFTADELWDWARIYDGEHGQLATRSAPMGTMSSGPLTTSRCTEADCRTQRSTKTPAPPCAVS